jgi:dTDP-4-dehydrorhamnose reductase
LLTRLADGDCVEAIEDQIVTPTYVPHLCDAVLDLVIDGAAGVVHLTNGEPLSWAAFGRRLATAGGYPSDRVVGISGAAAGQAAARPGRGSLASRHGRLLPPLDEAIRAFTRGSLLRRTTRIRELADREALQRKGIQHA